MRKRKLFIGTMIALAVAFLGIGYAAASGQTLTVNGGATAESSETLDIIFTGGAKAANGNVGTTAGTHQIGDPATSVTLTATGFTKAGDTLVYEFTTANNSTEFDAVLDTTAGNQSPKTGYSITNTNDTYFSVSISASSTINHKANSTAGTGTLTVTITCEKTPIDSQSTTITLVAHYKPAVIS